MQATHQAIEIITEQAFDKYGIRVINNYSENVTYSVGDVLPLSYRWDDGEPTDDELYGTSAIEVDALNLERRLMRLRREYGSLGSQIVLIACNQYVYGQDSDEVEMQNAVVLATL